MAGSHMHTWMVPRNKRTLYHIPDTLFLFISGLGGVDWAGDRSVQRTFEAMLEDAGLKAPGQPYDPNSGGARTYKAQLECLGLTFLDDRSSPDVYRPTLAGAAILEGANPWPILRWQVLKLQYPSPYSERPNVRIDPAVRIRPFSFLLRLLDDDDIGHLTQEEVGKIVVVYARDRQSFDDVKETILNHRARGDAVLPETFMQDSTAPRIRDHDLQRRIAYLEDKANIFFNYLESTRLVVRSDGRNRMELNPEMRSLLHEFERTHPEPQAYSGDAYRFQRRFGLPPGKRKDTRRFGDGSIGPETMKERMVMRTFYDRATTNLVLAIDEDLIDSISGATAVPRNEVASILERNRPRGVEYFEERYLDMASKGRSESREFELATAELFETVFGYVTKHVGDVTPGDRPGGNPDVVVISEAGGYCGIIDTKAYLRYSITNDHRNRMVLNYLPNYHEHVDDEELAFFLYVSGGFARPFDQQVAEIAAESGVDGAGISAKSLVNLTKRAEEESFDHEELRREFSRNRMVTVSEAVAD